MEVLLRIFGILFYLAILSLPFVELYYCAGDRGYILHNGPVTSQVPVGRFRKTEQLGVIAVS